MPNVRVVENEVRAFAAELERHRFQVALRGADEDAAPGLDRSVEGEHRNLRAERERFERWTDVVQSLPRRQTRVATWPVVTVFGAIARPRVHVFVKPLTIRRAAEAYGFDLEYRSTPGWETYSSVLELARLVRADLVDLKPRDQIDVQSFLWVLGSDEYADARAA